MKWKDVDLSQVPQFLIFDERKFVRRIVGWQGDRPLMLDALASFSVR